jgi:hypothetical protein
MKSLKYIRNRLHSTWGDKRSQDTLNICLYDSAQRCMHSGKGVTWDRAKYSCLI